MPNSVWGDFFPTPKNKVNSMANLLRSAKSGNNWTANELLAYNIEVQHATTTAFFNTVDLPETSVSETILNNLQEPAGPLSKIERKFFQLMADVEYPCAEVAAVNDFAVFLLSLLDYDHDDRRLHTDKEMTFYMAGQHVGAKADVVLMDTERFLLLILEEDKRRASATEPKYVAEAIAAASMNNARRLQSGLPPLERQVIPGITMVGTAMIFYRFVVSTTLLTALATSNTPAEPTVVLKYTPPVPNPDKYNTQGMRPLENRRIVFQCLEALKAIINVRTF